MTPYLSLKKFRQCSEKLIHAGNVNIAHTPAVKTTEQAMQEESLRGSLVGRTLHVSIRFIVWIFSDATWGRKSQSSTDLKALLLISRGTSKIQDTKMTRTWRKRTRKKHDDRISEHRHLISYDKHTTAQGKKASVQYRKKWRTSKDQSLPLK